MPIPLHLTPLFPLDQPPDRDSAKQYPIRRDTRNPHVHEARREIIAVRAQRAPALDVAAEGLVSRCGGGEVMAAVVYGL